MSENNSSGTNTVLIVILLLIVVAGAVWFYMKSNTAPATRSLDVDVNLPEGTPSELPEMPTPPSQ